MNFTSNSMEDLQTPVQFIFCFLKEFTFFVFTGEAAAAVTLNCSNPNAESLLKALEMSVFQRKAIRPVVSLQSPTQVNVSFTLYAILGVVSQPHFISSV